MKIVLHPDGTGIPRIFIPGALQDNLRPVLGDRSKSSVSVDDPEGLVRRVHDLHRRQQVDDDRVTQVRNQETDDHVTTTIKTKFESGQIFFFAFDFWNFVDGCVGEDGREEFVVEEPDRRKDGQPVEEGKVAGWDEDQLEKDLEKSVDHSGKPVINWFFLPVNPNLET